MNILIVEDDRLTLLALQHSLEDLGHDVATAMNGEEGINMAAGGRYDLILCDVMMPGISGLSFITILRTVHLCNTPVIMISSLSNKPLLEAAFQAGANDFIAKPFTNEELEEKIEKFNTDKNINEINFHE